MQLRSQRRMYGFALSEKCCTDDRRQVTQLVVSAELRTQLRGQDLNLRPRGYEPRELPGCSTPRHISRRPAIHPPPRVTWILALAGRGSRGVAAIYIVDTRRMLPAHIHAFGRPFISDNSQNRLIRTSVEDRAGLTRLTHFCKTTHAAAVLLAGLSAED